MDGWMLCMEGGVRSVGSGNENGIGGVDRGEERRGEERRSMVFIIR